MGESNERQLPEEAGNVTWVQGDASFSHSTNIRGYLITPWVNSELEFFPPQLAMQKQPNHVT